MLGLCFAAALMEKVEVGPTKKHLEMLRDRRIWPGELNRVASEKKTHTHTHPSFGGNQVVYGRKSGDLSPTADGCEIRFVL